MDLKELESDFRQKVCSQVELLPEGDERFKIFTPFGFDDGDSFIIVLKKEGDRWLFTDEGDTYMHLSYEIPVESLERGTRQKIITNALNAYRIEERNGELIYPLENGNYGNAFYSFLQALLKFKDLDYLTRERVKSTFLEDFRESFKQWVPEERRTFDWYDREKDPHKHYQVDCRINGMERPVFVFALNSDGRTRDATISLLQFEKWSLEFEPLAIFEDQESINRKVLARFSDIGGKMFSDLYANEERIEKYVSRSLE